MGHDDKNLKYILYYYKYVERYHWKHNEEEHAKYTF